MELFNLPHTCKVNKVIAKNAFDGYTNAKQKRLFTDLVARISWTHKLATDTINLEAVDIKEIQVFRIELKVKEDIQGILNVIDKAIPYAIVFIVEHEGSVYLSTSAKHQHPLNENNAVIDWTFKTDWFNRADNKYCLNLKKSIDAVYHDLCVQLSGKPGLINKPLGWLIEYERQISSLKKEIAKLRALIPNSKQFNHKVELNIKLKELEERLQTILREDEGQTNN